MHRSTATHTGTTAGAVPDNPQPRKLSVCSMNFTDLKSSAIDVKSASTNGLSLQAETRRPAVNAPVAGAHTMPTATSHEITATQSNTHLQLILRRDVADNTVERPVRGLIATRPPSPPIRAAVTLEHSGPAIPTLRLVSEDVACRPWMNLVRTPPVRARAQAGHGHGIIQCPQATVTNQPANQHTHRSFCSWKC